jgi:hypothetical protein
VSCSILKELSRCLNFLHTFLYTTLLPPAIVIGLVITALTLLLAALLKLPPQILRPAVAAAVGALAPLISRLAAEGKTIEEIVQEIRGEPEVEGLEIALSRVIDLCAQFGPQLDEVIEMYEEKDVRVCGAARDVLFAMEDALEELTEGLDLEIRLEDLVGCGEKVGQVRLILEEVC